MRLLTLLTSFSLLLSPAVIAQDTQPTKSEKSAYGELSGQVRIYNIFDPAYIDTANKRYNIDASALGGHLKYTTPTLYNIGLHTALYHVRELQNNELNPNETIVGAGRFLSDDLSPKSISTENQIFYKNKRVKLTVGQQIFDSPMTKQIVTYLPSVFLGTSLTTKYGTKSSFTLSHLNAMAPGSRSPVEFGLIGEGTNTAGATQNFLDNSPNPNASTTRGKFDSIESIALGKSVPNTKGLAVLGIDHQINKKNSFRFWNYYADDIMNMLYVETEHKFRKATVGWKLNLQYLRQDQIGDKIGSLYKATGITTNFDAQSSYLYGAKLSFNKAAWKGFIAYNHSGDARLFNPWGGDPAFTSSFFSRNSYRADVDAYKLSLNYAVTKTSALVMYHSDYGTSSTPGAFLTIPGNTTFTEGSQRAIESGLLLSYRPTKAWHLFTGFIYKTSEYKYNNDKIEIFDVDMVLTYTF